MHGPIWHYLFEVGHFHYMMDEHISEYSSFEAFCISVCSSLHTGAYPLSEGIGPSTGFIHFWSSCRPRELHTGAYPPSPTSSDLSQVSLSFDLVVDPHELSYWGISSPAGSAGIFTLASFGFGPLDQITILSVWVRVRAAPISIGHLLVSSVRVRGRTYINRPSSYQFSFWDRTYIDRSSPCHVSFRVKTAPISIGHHPISLCLSRGRTYIDRPSPCHVSFRVGTAPISIGHHLISLCLSRGCTYIDQSCFYHFSYLV